MIQRCTNPKQKSYATYGARGIAVCERWRQSFEAFYTDMGPRPSPKHTLERRNNNEGYSKENCSWETRLIQGRNKSNNRMITYKGRTQCMTAWEEELGWKPRTLYQRIVVLKWSVEDAMTLPVGQLGHYSRRRRQ
jgi:hypothetical protein